MQTYTSKQIKQAFWKQFHLHGELFFDYLGTDEENKRSTNSQWVGFFEELVMIEKAEKEITVERPAGYYWVRFDGDADRWHIAYHNIYGWTLSYEFSSPAEGYTSNDEAEKRFSKIIGPIEKPE